MEHKWSAMWAVYYVLMGVAVKSHAYALIEVLYAYPYSNKIIRFHSRWMAMNSDEVSIRGVIAISTRSAAVFFDITHGFNGIALWLNNGSDFRSVWMWLCDSIEAGIFIHIRWFSSIVRSLRRLTPFLKKCWLRRRISWFLFVVTRILFLGSGIWSWLKIWECQKRCFKSKSEENIVGMVVEWDTH